MQEPPSTPRPSFTPPVAAGGRRASLQLDVAARSDQGLARAGNEDSFLAVSRPAAKGQPAWAVLAVCDGMGGAAAGEVASAMAVDVLREVMTAEGTPLSRNALGRRLLRAVEEAAARVHEASLATLARKGMGTTATACAIAGDALFIAQVGDSRAYLLREGRLTQLTRDQTLAMLMMERGQLTPEEAASFPLGHVILQAVGTAPRVEVDLTRVRLARGDVLLVCSDGLSGVVPHDAIRAVLAGEPTAAAMCDTLIALANEGGGPDNITAVVARVRGDALPPPSGPPVPEKAILEDDAPSGAGALGATALGALPGSSTDAVMDRVIARLARLFRWRRERQA